MKVGSGKWEGEVGKKEVKLEMRGSRKRSRFSRGGQTAILVRWSAAQRTNKMLADQRTGKNSGPAPADYQN
jgi:hypothetical protein